MTGVEHTNTMLYLIEILHQTTTGLVSMKKDLALYLIEILHQTTTSSIIQRRCKRLYLIEILHQTTTNRTVVLRLISCILSKFYIKPQLARIRPYSAIVVSYRNSTSNHNWRSVPRSWMRLYLIEILHQTTTLFSRPVPGMMLYLIEILHQTTTLSVPIIPASGLYLIEILHQTTTALVQ